MLRPALRAKTPGMKTGPDNVRWPGGQGANNPAQKQGRPGRWRGSNQRSALNSVRFELPCYIRVVDCPRPSCSYHNRYLSVRQEETVCFMLGSYPHYAEVWVVTPFVV